MIISKIIGGLGNQMFQYAAARALSVTHRVPLRLDISGFESYALHQGFELERVFNGRFDLVKPTEMRSVLGWQNVKAVRRILLRPSFRNLKKNRFLIEPHFHFWPGIHAVVDPCYLIGYWQSERYFSEIADLIRADFTFRQPVASCNAELIKQIRSVSAVSLHVRRGDYAKNQKTTAKHGLLSIKYYTAAINRISEEVETPHYFVFSDDLDWVRRHLDIPQPATYVSHNQGAESYNDMRLMSLCEHHIIANSTFSWWGAWLNPSDDKVVVGPRRWFTESSRDTSDLYCANWVVL